MSIIVKKNTFHIPSFTFQNGRTLPIDMGYETYGTLNADKVMPFSLPITFLPPVTVPENTMNPTN